MIPMNVIDLFEKLSTGPLSNLYVGVDGTGTVEEKNYPQILNHTNDALTQLHTKFLLNEKDVMVEMRLGTTNYHLTRRFAQSNLASPEPEWKRYIKDLPEEPFEEDVAKILEVFNSYGMEYAINDDEALYSVFTPHAKMIQIRNPLPGRALCIHYQALHPKLTPENLEAEIDIPVVLEEALLAYIAFKIYSGMNTETSGARAQEHLAIYTGICADAITFDQVSTSTSTNNTRFQKRGWV